MIDESLTAEIFSNELQAEISLGGASDYEQLENKPKINGITLSGNKTGGALGVVNEPPSEGTNGQVLATNGSGARYWKTISGGGVGETDFEALDNRPLYNGNIMSHATDIPEVKTAAWDAKYNKPSGGIPKTDLANAVQTSLGKADTALQEHQSLSAYRTASAQDQIDAAQTSAISQHTSQITATQGMISDAWNGSTTYTIGQYCIYNNALYRCKVQHQNQRPPNATYWDAVSVSSEIATIGNTYSASWICESSTAVNTRLTNNITLPVGKYLIQIFAPISTDSSSKFYASLVASGGTVLSPKYAYLDSTYGTQIYIVNITSNNATVYAASGGSGAIAWQSQYLDRGGITAIKIK